MLRRGRVGRHTESMMSEFLRRVIVNWERDGLRRGRLNLVWRVGKQAEVSKRSEFLGRFIVEFASMMG